MKYKEKKTCRSCGTNQLKTILDLNDQPLANAYHAAGEQLDTYPLKLNLCTDCYHAQLSVVVDPDEMFKNYLYVSGTTATLRGYFEDFYDIVMRYAIKNEAVLEIACNDGTQLEVFKNKGWETYGIDPAKNLYELSSKKGFDKVVCDYFNEESALSLGKKMDVIVAENVFAHTDDISDFLRCCKLVSHKDTKIFIQTSQANMFINNEFDTIYHEHLSYFCANSMNTVLKRNGLFLQGVIKTPIHGTSYVFVISNTEVDQSRVEEVLLEEEKEGKISLEFYERFASQADKIVKDLKGCIAKYKEQGYTVVGYGAAAKAMTLLNFGKVKLNFIVDDNPLKHELLTPGMDIIIKGPEALRSDKKMLIIPLAWNFYNEIIKRIAKERSNPEDIFVKYFPKLEVSKNDN